MRPSTVVIVRIPCFGPFWTPTTWLLQKQTERRRYAGRYFAPELRWTCREETGDYMGLSNPVLEWVINWGRSAGWENIKTFCLIWRSDTRKGLPCFYNHRLHENNAIELLPHQLQTTSAKIIRRSGFCLLLQRWLDCCWWWCRRM